VLPGFTAPGSFAQYLAVPHAAANLARLPEGLDPALAAILGCRATTAWAALTGPGRLQGGEWLAVIGGGGVGTAALILGRALGARVVVVDVVADKLAQARALGAEAVVNARDGGAAEAVREVTGGGAHVALEALGRAETVETALGSLRHRGRMVQVGMPAGAEVRMALPWDLLYSRQLSVHGTRGMAAHRFPSLLGLIAAGRVDLGPMVGRRIALSQVSAELAAMDGPAPPGVAVVTDFDG
jgi:alcohol dehydrogenase